jgi:hypothetical protein
VLAKPLTLFDLPWREFVAAAFKRIFPLPEFNRHRRSDQLEGLAVEV